MQKYTDVDKALALAAYEAHGHNLKRAAKFASVPRNTLRHWVAGKGVSAHVSTLKRELSAALADKMEERAHQFLDAMPSALPDATLQQLAVTLGILIDKSLLLREPSASRKTELA